MPNRSMRRWLPWLALAATVATAAGRSLDAASAELPADIGAGTLLIRRADLPYYEAAPLATDVSMSIAGAIARVTVTQTFRNTTTDWVEAVYAFPLPDGAAVDRLSMRIGDRLVEGEIRERQQAEAIYRDARDSGRQASLVSQSRPNLFTTCVANIAPGASVDITIGYLETAEYAGGEFSLRFPMTLTPRYVPAGATGEAAAGASGLHGGAAAASNEALGTPGGKPGQTTATALPGFSRRRPPGAVTAAALNEATVHVVLDAGLPLEEISGGYHEIRATRSGTRYEIETAAPKLRMDRDFVLTWRPQVGSVPAVAALSETRGDATYALLMILPPSDLETYRPEPRELIFVIDTSGSMGGQSIEQAKRALGEALGRLHDADRFNVFQFNSTTSSLYRSPEPWTPERYSHALGYVGGLDADGGTEMGTAISAALAQPASPGYLRQVVFLTDGGVANETELFGMIKRRLGDARLFTIGIGAAPNSYFMRKAAAFGRGTYTHIGDASEIASAMDALFDKIERTALTDITVDWPAAVEFYPARVPDLYAGEPLLVAGRLDGQLDGQLAVEVFARSGGVPWSQRVVIETGAAEGIAALWARRKIEYLMDGRVDGYSESLIRRLVVGVALEHGLVSRYTSMVAVEKTPSNPPPAPAARRLVANMAPAGSRIAGFPQTGSTAPLYRWLGLLLLAVSAAGLVLRLRVPR